MPRTTTVIIGAGQAGLAMSRCLSELDIEHVVLERGKLAQRWRSQSWDSLRLLTPNWMTRLPGFQYDGDDLDGFMSVPELIAFFERYAASSSAPVLTDTAVQSVERSGNGFRVVTDRGVWSASSVVVATGYCDLPAVPAASRGMSPSVLQMVAPDYRRPDQLPEGGVLVVGASSTGVQLADEIQRSGRQVTLAVGRHTRLPRRHRGRDILWWLDQLGVLSAGSRRRSGYRAFAAPAVPPVGGQARSLIPRSGGAARPRVSGWWAGSATSTAIASASPMISSPRPPRRTSRWPRSSRGSIGSSPRRGVAAAPPEPFTPTWPLAADAPDSLDLKDERIETVIWATGYRRAYPWLRVPVFDAPGEIRHNGGITPESGLYVLGLNFQRRRNSSFIDGVGDDAWVIAQQIAQSMAGVRVA